MEIVRFEENPDVPLLEKGYVDCVENWWKHDLHNHVNSFNIKLNFD